MSSAGLCKNERQNQTVTVVPCLYCTLDGRLLLIIMTLFLLGRSLKMLLDRQHYVAILL